MIETPAFMDSSTHPALYSLTVMDENPAADASYSCFIRTKHASDIYRFTDEKLSGCERTYNSELLRYLGSSRNRPYMRMLYGLAAILTALIMTGGISLVYNSFAISVSDRTKQFGLLSSVGATPKQLRGMVFREALLLGAIGIPLGIGAGILGIGVTLHFTGSYFVYLMYSDSVVMSLHVSWTAVGIAALTALVTVLVSAWVPARRAGRDTAHRGGPAGQRHQKTVETDPFFPAERLCPQQIFLPAVRASRHGGGQAFCQRKKAVPGYDFFAVYQYCAFYLCQLLFFVYPEKCV